MANKLLTSVWKVTKMENLQHNRRRSFNMIDTDMNAFVQWFQSNGGFVDTKVMGVTEFPGSGRGAIALCDIPVCASSIPIDVADGQLILFSWG